MAVAGRVTKLTEETVTIKSGQYENTYSYVTPYTTQAGKYIAQGASYLFGGKIKEGDGVSYSYAQDDFGGKYIKHIEVIEATGGSPTPAPKQTTYSQPNPQQNQSKGAYEGNDKSVMIYRQHAEKLIAEFLSNNPEEIIIQCAGEGADKLTSYTICIQKYSDLLVQNFCMIYGLEYVNKRGVRDDES